MDITVSGVAYEIPALDSLTIGESKILKRHSGMTLDQVFDVEGLDGGVIGGLLAVAMKRNDPLLRDNDLDERVDALNMFEIMENLAEIASEAPDPTQGGQPPVENDSNESRDELTSSSGNGGDEDSELPLEPSNLVFTGAPISDTAADSNPTTSAA